ncbi:ATP-binding protein [Saccharomonospora piscinae]|uniref:ATP-binding protein n=1 Tax=Saccharomonospora piscinae TaxID=687388 RepID=A0A1V8ZWV4_SACPI|nr:ATP-binding protein [Saccharomonospora piscinae]OQO89399.1 ATP-binding protein [Saccharomonospora piscinae]TLW91091.1 ATP-binding protein [Saccharomonospora piscinae]
MNRRELADWLGPGCRGPVELRVPADARQLVLVRMLAQGVAEREGFPPDEVTDIVLAVDEACASLVRASVPGALLTCRLSVAFGKLRVEVSSTVSPTGPAGVPSQWSWRVLDTVTDSLSAWRHELDPRRDVDRIVHIDFAKQVARHPTR